MPNTQRYRQLKSEMRRLRSHFLPKKFDPTVYSERKFDRARAFRILAHAEIEFFIENIALDVVEHEYEQWKLSKEPSYVVICLMASCRIGWQDTETEDLQLHRIDPPKIRKEDESINQIIGRSVEQFRNIVEANNGIKSQNLKRILMPIGIALSDLKQTWLNNMESFGSIRGFHAHTSRIGLKNPLDPKSEMDKVDLLMEGLKELDTKINELPKFKWNVLLH